MARPARLLYLASNKPGESGENVEVLATCDDGIPMGWIFLFGGRNYWEPDDTVRDGAARERARFETPLEVGEARLTNAIDGFRDAPHLWVWFSSLELLRRSVKAKGRQGFLRLDAAWAFANDKQREKTNAIPAFAENYVNMVSLNQIENVPQYVSPLEKFCPFVPHCKKEDAKRARDAGSRLKDLPEPARAAALLVGVPPEDPQRFVQRVETVYAPEYAKLASLPAYPNVKDRLSYSSAAVPKNLIEPGKQTKEAPKGFIGKLLKIVGR